jgi:MYXO-CTERM domain-containing protein
MLSAHRRVVVRRIALTVLAALSLSPAAASANGNVSHQWISRTAVELTPAGGSLAALVGDPALRQALYTGTMFPDWGYTPGVSPAEANAGEASHWEPVQDAYRRWIVEQYAPPWSDEARLHLAFYFGMTSHGIADQAYDSMFFERSKFYEQKDHSAFDTDTDVMWAATTGPGETPVAWVPTTPLIDLFDSVIGETIDPSIMKQKLALIGLAILAVSTGSQDPEQVSKAELEFPWAAANDDEPLVPGNPPHEAEVARRYWRSNWALLHGDTVPRPVLWTYPADGGSEHATASMSIDSWVSVVFARALDEQALSASQFHIVDSTDTPAPFEIDLFYGNGSHVVHLKPTSDLIDDEVYVVTVDPGVQTIHGESLAGWRFTFSTGLDGPTPINDDSFWDLPDPYGDPPAESSGGPEDTTGAVGSSGAGPETSGDPPGPTEGGTTVAPGSSGEGSTSAGAEGGASDGGCGCTATTGQAGLRGLGLAVLLGLGARRRRRA